MQVMVLGMPWFEVWSLEPSTIGESSHTVTTIGEMAQSPQRQRQICNTCPPDSRHNGLPATLFQRRSRTSTHEQIHYQA